MATMRSSGVAIGAFVVAVLTPSIARAGLAACGDAWLFGAGDCRLLADDECVGGCEPAGMATACAARLYADCDAGCAAAPEVACTLPCLAECGEECLLWQVHEDPADSMRLCASSCGQGCDADCEGAEGEGCSSTCGHNCGEKCEQAECRGDDASVGCAPKCEAACEGACRARASGDCQLSCQSAGYAACAAELVVGCRAGCGQASGAVFCGGQYLDADDVQACVDEIEAAFLVHLAAPMRVEPAAGSGCAVSAAGWGPGWLLALLGALGVRRRGRRG